MTRSDLIPVAPRHTPRTETRGELIADGIIHVLGIALGAAATTAFIILLWSYEDPARKISIFIYAGCLMTMLICSATYNILAKDNRIGILRRLDHSAIFLMIAGTYTPLCLMVLGGWTGAILLAVVWAGAVAGATIKIFHMHRFERLTVPIYLALGWAAIFAIVPLYQQASTAGFVFLVVGGGLYTVGTLFYVWKTLPYQNAIWHGFVLSAAICHFVSILIDTVVPVLA
ncbi:PAQR family membrane homeostasis protein TrhA [Pseudovibrio sp. SPO723]|uniref:PAQR family membrane homeostasis protein TrhA n=1 Tax=Nesiotobacter zosterae TaxID=392721 RepID=UPI0029C419F6|nr:hemolysin III family protein [Pseudovibrio sp. SPO723]MDX5595219.1 hemolysin III family protein [Pseudovibrio sp. SPO723]